jgi:peptidoglycan hydrolase-like protein with peptidoglycan-binding domain
LQARGFLQGAVDGVFGAATETAVKAAQQRYGLETDGIVGASTWDALLR